MLNYPDEVEKYPEEFIRLIDSYNQIPDSFPEETSDEYQTELKAFIEKIFLLQKLTHFMNKVPTDPEMFKFRHATGQGSYEEVLQRYGVHRDASILLQSVEFANIVHGISKKLEPPFESREQDPLTIYEAMQKNEEQFESPETEGDILNSYVSCNQAIMGEYLSNEDLEESIIQQKHFLSLIYPKMEAIQGIVKQNFDVYTTKVLGNEEGNNKNFTLNIEGEQLPVVIRVEDRESLEQEAILQRDPVSQFFSQDYASVILPFKEDDEFFYRPVVFSEHAAKGSLESFSTSLYEKPDEEIIEQTVKFFNLISEFSKALINSGHYHPDIKLSNFLTDGERLIVSDRKTITEEKNPVIADIASSLPYAPPEFRNALRISKKGEIIGFKPQASQVRVDLERTYMPYQIGMALKEFLLNTQGNAEEAHYGRFLQWSGLALEELSEEHRDTFQNLSILIQELTRKNPEDRLQIDGFQALLQAVSLPKDEFLERVELTSPAKDLSSSKDLDGFVAFLDKGEIDPSNREAFQERLRSKAFQDLLQEPRIDIREKILNSSIFEAARSMNEMRSDLSAPEGGFDELTDAALLIFKSLPEETRIALPEQDQAFFDDLIRISSSEARSVENANLRSSPKAFSLSSAESGSQEIDPSTVLVKEPEEEIDPSTVLMKGPEEEIDPSTVLMKNEETKTVSGNQASPSSELQATKANQSSYQRAIECFRQAQGNQAPSEFSLPATESSETEKNARSIKETVQRGDASPKKEEAVEEQETLNEEQDLSEEEASAAPQFRQ